MEATGAQLIVTVIAEVILANADDQRGQRTAVPAREANAGEGTGRARRGQLVPNESR